MRDRALGAEWWYSPMDDDLVVASVMEGGISGATITNVVPEASTIVADVRAVDGKVRTRMGDKFVYCKTCHQWHCCELPH